MSRCKRFFFLGFFLGWIGDNRTHPTRMPQMLQRLISIGFLAPHAHLMHEQHPPKQKIQSFDALFFTQPWTFVWSSLSYDKEIIVNMKSTISWVKVTTSVRQNFIREIKQYRGINVQHYIKHNLVLLESQTLHISLPAGKTWPHLVLKIKYSESVFFF